MTDDPFKALGPAEATRDAAYESAVLRLLLEDHRAAHRSLLAIGLAGRLLSAVLAISVGLGPELNATQVIGGILVAALIALVWWRGDRRTTSRIRGIEETLSRMAGGPAETAYIEARFSQSSQSRPVDQALALEPGLWFAVNIVVLLINA